MLVNMVIRFEHHFLTLLHRSLIRLIQICVYKTSHISYLNRLALTMKHRPSSSNTSVQGTYSPSSKASKGHGQSDPSGSNGNNKPNPRDKSQQDQLLMGIGAQFSGWACPNLASTFLCCRVKHTNFL